MDCIRFYSIYYQLENSNLSFSVNEKDTFWCPFFRWRIRKDLNASARERDERDRRRGRMKGA